MSVITDAKHEDQLTRAALIVLKLVPLAHEAFLSLGGCASLSALPRPRFDMQTEHLVPLAIETEDNEVTELVSVFLGPHEKLTGNHDPNLASERRARYDGVIQYGSRLLVVIESKLYANASEQQSLDINTKGLTCKEARLAHVRWQDLLDRWWKLTELGVLGHAEEEILSDFFDNAEDNFGDLLPYTDLERCGGNEKRLLRRLRMILEQATGLLGENYKGGVATPSGEIFSPGAHVMFPSDQVKAIQRVALSLEGDHIRLGGSPGEQKIQYQKVYGDPRRVEALVALTENPGWDLKANFHIAYRNCRPEHRWYPPKHLPGPVYARQWIDDVQDGHARGRWRAQIDDPIG